VFSYSNQWERSSVTTATIAIMSFRNSDTTFSVISMFNVCMQVISHYSYCGVMCLISGYQRYVGNILPPCNTENGSSMFLRDIRAHTPEYNAGS
jgi:hypothetical protein